MKQFSIEVISQKAEKYNNELVYWGAILIEPLYERFLIPVSCWAIEQYQQQWQEGIERIKHQETSCLVTAIKTYKNRPVLTFWAMWKQGDTIFFNERDSGISKKYERIVKVPYDTGICYQLVQSGDDKDIYTVSMKVNEFFKSVSK